MVGVLHTYSGLLFSRARLQERLAAATLRPITLILAPAGCGKSVALRHFLERLPAVPLAFDVRPEHATLLAFARGLTDVLHPVAPGARSSVGDAVRSALATERPGETLARWLCTHLGAFAGAVAIDDFHLAEADPQSAEFLASLIERTKANVTWIIASRSTMHLPVSTWVLRGDADIPIDENDLKFTAGEAREAARDSALALPDIEHLLRATSGWATAFSLALRISAESGDVQGAAMRARKLSYEYLAEHIYRLLSDDERDLLTFAVLLPEIDVSVLESAGYANARAMLAALHKRDTFLSVIPSENASPSRYRFHDLFRDFLQNEMQLRGETAYVAELERAARALHVCGRTVAALRLYALARCTPKVLELLRAHGFDLTRQAHSDTVELALSSLPEAERSSNAVALGLRGQHENNAGHFDRAEALYRRALERCEDRDLRAMLVARLSLSLSNTGKSPVSLLEPVAFDANLSDELRGELLALLAMSYAWFGGSDDLPALFDEVEAIALRIDSNFARAAMLQCLGMGATLSGDAARAHRVLKEASEVAIANGMYKLAIYVYSALSTNAQLNEEDLVRAWEFTDQAADAAEKSGEVQFAQYSTVYKLDIERHRGHPARLQALLDQCAALTTTHPNFAAVSVEARAMLAAWEGRFGDAYRLEAEACNSCYLREDRMLSKSMCALFLVAAGEREHALRVLQEVADESTAAGPKRPYFPRYFEMSRSICALTEALAGRSSAALRLLHKKSIASTPVANALRGAVETIVRGLEGGVDRAVLDRHLRVLEARSYGGYAKILEAIVAQCCAPPTKIEITPTELSVLRALVAGQAPKEIALVTGSSIHTVRGHIRRVISKFGCSGRDQAIRIAQARKLL